MTRNYPPRQLKLVKTIKILITSTETALLFCIRAVFVLCKHILCGRTTDVIRSDHGRYSIGPRSIFGQTTVVVRCWKRCL